MSARALRSTAVLLPAALLLHELVYGLSGGGLLSAHGYLEVVVPVAVAAASLLAVSSLIPKLHRRAASGEPPAPALLAAIVLAAFGAQELTEALLSGAGLAGVEQVLATGWLAPPIALALGGLCAATIGWLDRAGAWVEHRSRPRPLRGPVGSERAPAALRHRPATAAGALAFGFARRPPPARC